jgi:DNA-binding MarR family transcriptional regulator
MSSGYECRIRASLEEPIMEQNEEPEPAIQSYLEQLGISQISEWDVLDFIYCHRVSLASTDQIARLVGYAIEVVDSALARLEREKLIERSRLSNGVRFYRIVDPTHAEQRKCLQQLVSLSRSRNGRLLLLKQFKPAILESLPEE